MNLALLCGKESCSYLYALCAEHKAGGNSSAVCDTACGDNGDGYSVNYLRNKAHSGIFAYVTARFCTLCDYCGRTASFHSLCECNTGYYGDNLDTCVVPRLHKLAGVARTGRYHRNLFIYNKLCKILCVGAHKHYINAEGLICQRLCPSYLISQIVDRSRTACDYTYSACV